MKRILLITLLLLLGCSQEPRQIDKVKIAAVDSILEHSYKTLVTAKVIEHRSDSVTKQTIVKVIREIKVLNNEVEKYKEVSKLKTVAADKIVYKIDTVYIETKKNFWGKEKTNTTIKSDSSVVEKIDSTENQSHQ